MPENTTHKDAYISVSQFEDINKKIKKECLPSNYPDVYIKKILESNKGKITLEVYTDEKIMTLIIFKTIGEDKDLEIYKQFNIEESLYANLFQKQLLFTGYNTYMLWKSIDDTYYFYLKVFVEQDLSEYINSLDEEKFISESYHFYINL